MPNSHPWPSELQQLVDGKLSDEETDRIVGHLQSCADCSSLFGTLSVNTDSFIYRLRRGVDAGSPAAAAAKDVASTIGFTPHSPRQPHAEDRADRFVVVRKHASGGLGIIYIARDSELDREVALKEIQPKYAEDRDARSRFTREAEITGRLEHPNIVPIYALGTHQDGRPYYAMKLIRGESLKHFIDELHRSTRDRATGARLGSVFASSQGMGEFRQILRRFINACQAVDYAHSRDVIHRDLKPGNVMLGGYGETFVVDWGLAKAMKQAPAADAPEPAAAADDHAPALTMVGSVIGTPLYMSPEQALGEGAGDRVGPASDIYSLGAMLYHLLVGEPPFDARGKNILRRVIAGDFPRPLEHDRKIPKPLAAVCLKAMATDPRARYERVLDLIVDLEHWLADEPVTALTETYWAKMQRWRRRYRSWIQAAAVAATIAAVLIGWVVWRANSRQEAEQLAAAVEGVKTSELPALSQWLGPISARWTDAEPLLRHALQTAEVNTKSHRNLALALSLHDERALDLLLPDLASAEPSDIPPLCRIAKGGREELVRRVRRRLASPEGADSNALPLIAILATFAPQDESWNQWAPTAAQLVVNLEPQASNAWSDLLVPIGDKLLPSLEAIQTNRPGEAIQANLAYAVAQLGSHDIECVVKHYLDCEVTQTRVFVSAFKRDRSRAIPLLWAAWKNEQLPDDSHLKADLPQSRDPHAKVILWRKRQGFAAVALLALGEPRIWDELRATPDPTVRTWVARLAAESGIDMNIWVNRWAVEPTDDGRQLILWALGGYPVELLRPAERERFLGQLAADYLSRPDAGVHASLDWLLRTWKQTEAVQTLRQAASAPAENPRDWFVTRHGVAFSVVAGPRDALLGSTDFEWYGRPSETLYRARINRTFAISQTEVTAADFERVTGAPSTKTRHFNAKSDCPAIEVSWYDAARYCRMLSEAEGIPEDQMCFPPMDQIRPGMQLPDDYLQRTGYRLPTDAEWEVAARAGVRTRGSFGMDAELAALASWDLTNSENVSHPVAAKLPNPWGLFDCCGNVWEWTTATLPTNDMPTDDDGVVIDRVDELTIGDDRPRGVRGSGFSRSKYDARIGTREFHSPAVRYPDFGFRVAKTLPASPARWTVVERYSGDVREAEYQFLGSDVDVQLASLTPGVSVEPRSIRTPAVVRVRSEDGSFRQFTLSARSSATKTAYEVRGVVGELVWDLDRFPWPSEWRPERQDVDDFEKLETLPPIKSFRSPLQFRAVDAFPIPPTEQEYFGLRGGVQPDLRAGFYEIHLCYDEGLKLSVDGQTVYDGRHNVRSIPINFWRRMDAGKHAFHVTYFQRSGPAKLVFQLRELDGVRRVPFAE